MSGSAGDRNLKLKALALVSELHLVFSRDRKLSITPHFFLSEWSKERSMFSTDTET